MLMKAIIYISEAKIEFNETSLRELVEKSAAHNRSNSVTGYMWLKKNQFVQYIEGEAEDLNNLMLRIKQDVRHKVIYQVEDDNLNYQRFPNWHMRHIESAHEIDLEGILSELLSVLNRAYGSNEKLAAGVWRIADSISRRNSF